jgi:antitoxin MazE
MPTLRGKKTTQTNRVAKWGNSLAVRIPQEAAARIGLTEGSEVIMDVNDQTITIRRIKRITSLDELLKGVTPGNSGREVDFGPPVGREVW